MEKWEPFKDFFSLRDRVNKLFEHAHTQSGDPEYPVWIPTADIYETGEDFVVKAELPEVSEYDVSIKVEGNTLKIIGERKVQREGRSYHQVERSYGAFSRAFVLPEDVDQDNIKANLNDGVLKVILPRKSKELPRHIEIV